jgi:hypothetical protein
MVLPVLDGLDEMDSGAQPGYASRAARTSRACNAYLDGARQVGLVLTCRIDQYLDYSPVNPHEAVRTSITSGLMVGLASGLTTGLTAGVAPRTPGIPRPQPGSLRHDRQRPRDTRQPEKGYLARIGSSA